jgi:ferredoxin
VTKVIVSITKTSYAVDVGRSFAFLFCNRIEEAFMAIVIAEPCVGVKDTACLDVCPVDCIHPGKDEREFHAAPQLYINPEECICCQMCIPVCPVSAIYPEEDLPDKWKPFAHINAEWFAAKGS